MVKLLTWMFFPLIFPCVVLSQGIPKSISVSPRTSTAPVNSDADDPAVWIHPTNPDESIVIGTDKSGSSPGLYVWDMNGNRIQYIKIPNPNNVDVRYDIRVGGKVLDLVVTNSRPLRELKVFAVDRSSGLLMDMTTADGIKLNELEKPYGLGLYRRPSDGALFAILTTKTGDPHNLYQYRLLDDGTGHVKGTFVGKFGNAAIRGIAEGVAVDDELGYVYVSDEEDAVRKFYADRALGKNDEITAFAKGDGISGDREGIGIYKCSGGTGYLLVSSQGNSTVKVYPREGDNGDPTKHSLITTIDTENSRETDGLDVTSRPAGVNFPNGFLVTHDSPGKRFRLYAWEDIAGDFLSICPDGDKPSAILTRNEGAIPQDLQLDQNYPNPFNPATMIEFHVSKPGHIRIAIYNLTGQTVAVLVDQFLSAGSYSVSWDGKDRTGTNVPSGTYVYRISAGNTAKSRKLILMR